MKAEQMVAKKYSCTHALDVRHGRHVLFFNTEQLHAALCLTTHRNRRRPLKAPGTEHCGVKCAGLLDKGVRLHCRCSEQRCVSAAMHACETAEQPPLTLREGPLRLNPRELRDRERIAAVSGSRLLAPPLRCCKRALLLTVAASVAGVVYRPGSCT
eukprot:6195326-Pleurochrysis_carterae.AAC.1